jgi:hypothetical protein
VLAVRRSEELPIKRSRSLPAAGERIGARHLVRVTTLGAVDPGLARGLTYHPCRRDTVLLHLCLPGDRRACHLPGVVRACNSRGGIDMSHLPGATEVPRRVRLSLKRATGRGSPPHQ